MTHKNIKHECQSNELWTGIFEMQNCLSLVFLFDQFDNWHTTVINDLGDLPYLEQNLPYNCKLHNQSPCAQELLQVKMWKF